MKASQALKELAAEVQSDYTAAIQSRRSNELGWWLDHTAWNVFLAKAQILLRMLGPFGEPYCQVLAMDAKNESRHIEAAGGALKAIVESIARGRFATIEELVTAEVLGDLLGHADELIQKKYMLAAAVILRAVLEERLRKLMESKGLTIPERATIETLKQELVRANVVDKIVAKQIDHMASIGNAAAHNLATFNPDDVPGLYQSTLAFLAKFSP